MIATPEEKEMSATTSPFTFSSLNISIATPNISAIVEIYRLPDKH